MIRSVCDFLENSAKKFPDKIAFKDTKEELTFSELLEYSKKVGSILPKGAIGLYMKKSCKLISIMLGVAQAGAFYSVIDIDLPKNRKQTIATLLNAKIIISDDDLFDEASKIFINFKVYKSSDILNVNIDEQKLFKVKNDTISTNPLYCNFTSGSTGVPKGVIISHASVLDFIPIFCSTLGLKENDIFANQAPFDFDVSVKDIYCTIFLGATCLLIPRDYFTNPVLLMDFIEDATIYIWAVSALLFLNTIKALEYKKPKINKIIYSGEIMPFKHLSKLINDLPDTDFINVYGPTEITCNCTFYPIDKNNIETNIIGNNFENRSVFLLNENDEKINTKDQIGEICVSGICLALGYLGGVETSFCKDKNRQVFYKTGDLGYYNNKGLLCISGRKDHQIKHMGHRLELNEIENISNNLNGVERSCAIYQNNNLILYYSGTIEKHNLRKLLKEYLPKYMLPNYIFWRTQLPINKNGKIDRNFLKDEYAKNQNDF